MSCQQVRSRGRHAGQICGKPLLRGYNLCRHHTGIPSVSPVPEEGGRMIDLVDNFFCNKVLSYPKNHLFEDNVGSLLLLSPSPEIGPSADSIDYNGILVTYRNFRKLIEHVDDLTAQLNLIRLENRLLKRDLRALEWSVEELRIQDEDSF